MYLEVHDQKLKKLLDNPNKLIKRIGLEMAKGIKKRFNEMISSPNFKEYLDYGLGKPHPLVGKLNGFYGINLNKNYRLIVEPLIEKFDDTTLKMCKNVNIKGVVDYHDGKIDWLIP